MSCSRTSRDVFRYAYALLATLLTLLVPGTARAQAVWGQVGTSSLMNASGFEMNYKWAPVQGWLGMGVSDSFNIGGYFQTQVHHTDLGLGDRYLPFVLSTDEFEQSRYFSARGVFVHRDLEQGSWTAFTGATSSDVSYSFYRAFDTGKATSGFIFQHKLGKRLSFQSFNLVQGDITSIQDLSLKVNDDLNLGISGGSGNSEHFVAIGGNYTFRKLRLLASYTSAGSSFVRVAGVSTMAPERVGANVRAYYVPWKRLQLNASHENMMSPLLFAGEALPRVSMDSASASAQRWQFQLSGGISTSTSGPLHTTTESYSLSRNITQRITASTSLMEFQIQSGSSRSWVTSVDEKISPRISVYQGLSNSGNSNNFVWGARLLTNRLTFSIENTTVYSPLAGGFGGKQYMQAWSFNISAPLFHGIRLHTDSYVDFSGKTRYTAWADGIGFARNGESVPKAAPVVESIGNFIVKGRVVDTAGKPVWGIAVQVDGQQTYSDSSGQFYLHFRKGETDPVAVLLDRSLNRNDYEIVQAPTTATAEPEEAASEVVIILRPVVPGIHPASK